MNAVWATDFDIDDDRVVEIDQLVGRECEEGWSSVPRSHVSPDRTAQ
jgi:hypothetical protein